MKDDNYFIKSEKGNYYLIVSKKNQIIPVHPIIKEFYVSDIHKKISKEFKDYGLSEAEKNSYRKQYLFFKSKGYFNNYEEQLTTNLGKDNIINKLSNLKQVLFEVTDACNLNCKYCGYGDLYGNFDKRENRKLDFSTAKLLIDYLWDYWNSDFNVSYNNIITFGFYGGEPLLNMSLIEKIITYVESKNTSGIRFKFTMTTNALLLNKYMDYLRDKDFSLLISLDGDELSHSYRIMKNGKNSFKKVIKNIHLLLEKHPDYFRERVNFNSVLHNLNSADLIYNFINKEFNKTTRISELNTNGIKEEKKKEFWEMFKDKFDNIHQANNCEELIENIFYEDPEITMLDNFINQYAGNTFQTYNDLLIDSSNLNFLPTGTCYPFQKKIFLTVNGKILPCEKIGQFDALGIIKDGSIHVNPDQIAKKYEARYTDLIFQCKNCYSLKTCAQCFYFLGYKNGKLFCPHFGNNKKFNEYSSNKLSYLEDKPQVYEKLFNEVFIS